MSDSAPTGQQSNPFDPRIVFAAVAIGFLGFVTLLYFVAIGDTGSSPSDGQAHAASNGLNGYSALVDLLEAEGHDVKVSRTASDLETFNLLIVTPTTFTDAEAFGEFLEERKDQGPTIVILPKWQAGGFPAILPDEIDDQVKDDWVQLVGAWVPSWTRDLPAPYTFEVEEKQLGKNQKGGFSGLGFDGTLPTNTLAHALEKDTHDVLVTDRAGRTLAFAEWGEEGSDLYENGSDLIFVTEPDLMNNYGMASKERAGLALALIKRNLYQEGSDIIFDVTLNGLSGSTNLLTLAFRPPFLAATLCLIAAMIVVGWRAFRRFGPPLGAAPAIAFGKTRLVKNGGALIVRARRHKMMGEPYIDLIAQRLRTHLGLSGHDEEALDEAIARRLPDSDSFSARANALRDAINLSDTVRAARALGELEKELKR